MGLSNTQMLLERYGDERKEKLQRIEEIRGEAAKEDRDLNELESEQVLKYRTRVEELDSQIEILATDVEREQGSRDVSALIRVVNEPAPLSGPEGPTVYRTFASYARDELIARYPQIASHVRGVDHAPTVREEAAQRLERAVEHTLSSDIAGLLPPQHIAQIMDIIDASRPVVASGRSVPLERGKLTHPSIAQRPEVAVQSSEKTEAGTAGMDVEMAEVTASTYLGAGNLSWQTINWSSPDALQLWFDLAAEAYARATENHATDVLEAAGGTISSGTLGTAAGSDPTFANWRAAAFAGVASIYSTTGGRARTNTLYLSADRFFQLAGLGTDQTLQVSAVGGLDIGNMTGTWSGLRVVGSYAFDQYTAIVGDSSAFLVGETAGAPVQMRAVEPSIGGMEVGVIGAFAAAVVDADRFIHISSHL